MRGFLLGLMISAAFIAGVLGSAWVVPEARATPTTILMRWEYLCLDKLDRNKLKKAGNQGWELVAGAAAGSENAFTESATMVWCFKRPLL